MIQLLGVKTILGFFIKFLSCVLIKFFLFLDPLTKNYLRSNLEEEKLIRIDQAVNTKRYFPVKDAKKILLREKYGLSERIVNNWLYWVFKKRKRSG